MESRMFGKKQLQLQIRSNGSATTPVRGGAWLLTHYNPNDSYPTGSFS